ncbi:MAG: TolC family protein [bacterium]
MGLSAVVQKVAEPDSWQAAAAQPPPGPTGTVTLADALSFALRHNPDLMAQAWGVQAAEALKQQAGLRGNPEIEVEFENFAGENDFRRFESAEVTVALSQTINLAGVRGKRKQLASREVELASWELEIARLDLVAEVSQRFLEVQAAQERLILAEEVVQLYAATLTAVSERVAAGKAAPPEKTRAQISLASVRIQLERTRRDLATARHYLASTWGNPAPNFTTVTGDFYAVTPPADADLAILVAQSPDLGQQARILEIHQAAVNLERAHRIPELTLSGGTRRFSESGETAYVMGVSVPLPLFDRNQGTVRAAQSKRAAAVSRQWATEANVRASLVSSQNMLSASYFAVQELKQTILPGAEQTYDAVLEGYRHGKYSYLSVLDAQGTLFEARSEYIDAFEDYHTTRVELERLIGAGSQASTGG